jgi:hypothetical protein
MITNEEFLVELEGLETQPPACKIAVIRRVTPPELGGLPVHDYGIPPLTVVNGMVILTVIGPPPGLARVFDGKPTRTAGSASD